MISNSEYLVMLLIDSRVLLILLSLRVGAYSNLLLFWGERLCHCLDFTIHLYIYEECPLYGVFILKRYHCSTHLKELNNASIFERWALILNCLGKQTTLSIRLQNEVALTQKCDNVFANIGLILSCF